MILQIIYFLLPAALANMMPVFVKEKYEYLNKPIDFGLKIGDKRILGDNKTFRGLIAGIVGSYLVVYLQLILSDFSFFRDLSLVDYSTISFLSFGFLMGFGTLFGDIIGSFIKRRLNIEPGKSLLIIDQINGAVGVGIFVLPFYLKSWLVFFYIIIVWTLGHFLIKYLGYLLKIDKKEIKNKKIKFWKKD